MTKFKTRNEQCDPKRLIQPLEAYILLPDRLCAASPDNMRYTPCMTDLIIKTAESSRWLTDTELIPVHWLTLQLEPQKMISVVAAVVPALSHRLTCPRAGRNLFRFCSFNKTQKRSLIETLPGVEKWNFDSLVNLQVVVVVQWPDPSSELFEKCNFRIPNAYTIRKALRKRKPITLGVPSHVRDTYYMDLRRICVPEKNIIFQLNRFTQSTAELALALLTALSRGIFKDSNAMYSHWLQTLVKPERIIYTKPRGHGTVFDTVKKFTQPNSEANMCQSSVLEESESQRKQVRGPEEQTNCESNHHWNTLLSGRPLKHARLGLIGLSGELPVGIARLARSAIGMEVIYYQKHPIPSLPYTHYENLKELLQVSDVVILADDDLNRNIPTDPKSQYYRYNSVKHKRKPRLWLTLEHFTCLQPHSVLICVTSIQCIDFSSLNLALRCGLLRGAGLTMPIVWFSRLAELEALRQLPNTFILPPATSSVCAHSDVRMQIAREILEVIAHFLSRPNSRAGTDDSIRFDFDHLQNEPKTNSKKVDPTHDQSDFGSFTLSSLGNNQAFWPGSKNMSNPYLCSITTSTTMSISTDMTNNPVKSWHWVVNRLNSMWKCVSRSSALYDQ
ncbi:unnamed protein product [Echinostoma caproni]|uniref:2-Hacid_dh_C domain-containing protein n=1 Tax=Echinostoma caproni TaxID=27848 RepID=A0A183AC53_9TREM|nr:unnamed protein product [Echinostoma caproni]